MHLERLLHRWSIDAMKQEGFDRMFAQSLFADWRNRYFASICKYLRYQRDAKEDGLKHVPFKNMEWLNAAAHILSHGDLELQDTFLRAYEDMKDEMVSAVLVDGYVVNLDGFIVDLPPC